MCMSQARVKGLRIRSWLVLQFPHSPQHLPLLVISEVMLSSCVHLTPAQLPSLGPWLNPLAPHALTEANMELPLLLLIQAGMPVRP